ncbi:MAG: histidine kinase [Eubacteriales bacterium]|nr:histidine kinase [Eubacteriales bacterium]
MRIKALSIKKKFVLVLIIFMVIPTCAISGWMYSKVSSIWIQKEYSNQSNELGNILKTTELQIKEIEHIIYEIYQDEDVAKTLKTEPQNRIPLDYVEMTNYMRSIQTENEYVDSSYLFSDTGEVFFQDSMINGVYQELYKENTGWQEQIKEKNGAVTWISTYDIQNSRKQKQYFSCAIVVKDIASSWEPLGVLVLNIDLSLFSNLFELLGQQDDYTTYIIADDKGSIIWSNHLAAAQRLDEEFFFSVQNSQETCSEQVYEEEQFVVTKLTSQYNGWNYISMKNKAKVIETGRWVLTTTIAQLFFILMFSVLGAFMIQRYIIYPIQKMVVAMSVPEKELMGKRLYIDQEDEIGKLYQSFNEMNARIESFIEKNNEMNEKEKEYQIQALNAQINPHFIYNTLDTLHWMALDIPAPEICKLINSFSEILRYSISKKESIVTLKEELTCIRNYINIYDERYEMDFARFEVDEAVFSYKTFKMLLQPIVENCIVHGFSQNMEQARINVIARVEGDEAVIRICDNGVGISSERIAYILSKDSDRVGLSNINQRLKLLYGENYGLKIISEKGQGTEVVLRFPKESLDI